MKSREALDKELVEELIHVAGILYDLETQGFYRCDNRNTYIAIGMNKALLKELKTKVLERMSGNDPS